MPVKFDKSVRSKIVKVPPKQENKLNDSDGVGRNPEPEPEGGSSKLTDDQNVPKTAPIVISSPAPMDAEAANYLRLEGFLNQELQSENHSQRQPRNLPNKFRRRSNQYNVSPGYRLYDRYQWLTKPFPKANGPFQNLLPRLEAKNESSEDLATVDTLDDVPLQEIYGSELLAESRPKLNLRVTGIIAAFIGSISMLVSLISAKCLIYKFDFPAELLLLSRFAGLIFPSVMSLTYFTKISKRHKDIWKRFKEHDTNLNFQRGALIAAKVLLAVVIILSRYSAAAYWTLTDLSVLEMSALLWANFGAGVICCIKPIWTPMLPIPFAVAGLILVSGSEFIFGKQELEFVNYPLHRLNGFGISCLTLVCLALNILILRYLRFVNWSIILSFESGGGILLAIILILHNAIEFRIPFGNESYWYIGLMAAGFTEELGFLIAHNYLDTAAISVIRLVEPILYGVTEYFLFQSIPDLKVVAGYLVFAVAILGWFAISLLSGPRSQAKCCRCFQYQQQIQNGMNKASDETVLNQNQANKELDQSILESLM